MIPPPSGSSDAAALESSFLAAMAASGSAVERERTLAGLDLYGTLHEKHTTMLPATLLAMYADVKDRTTRAVGGLTEDELFGYCESSVNPIIWAIGHCAHFYETMVLR
jgi:hypothetical protein